MKSTMDLINLSKQTLCEKAKFFACMGIVIGFVNILFSFLLNPAEYKGTGFLLFAVVAVFFYAISLIANACVVIYSETSKDKALLKQVKGAVLFFVGNFTRLILPVMLKLVVVFIGYLLFVIPGVYLSLRFMAFEYAVVLDKKDFKGAFDKSTKVMDGYKVKFLTLMGMVFTIVFVMQLIMGWLSTVLLSTSGLLGEILDLVLALGLNVLWPMMTLSVYTTLYKVYKERKAKA